MFREEKIHAVLEIIRLGGAKKRNQFDCNEVRCIISEINDEFRFISGTDCDGSLDENKCR